MYLLLLSVYSNLWSIFYWLVHFILVECVLHIFWVTSHCQIYGLCPFCFPLHFLNDENQFGLIFTFFHLWDNLVISEYPSFLDEICTCKEVALSLILHKEERVLSNHTPETAKLGQLTKHETWMKRNLTTLSNYYNYRNSTLIASRGPCNNLVK